MSVRSWSAQKAGLTRVLKTGDYSKVVAECRRVITEWQETGSGWPDDWHRWERALTDTWWRAKDAYVRGDLDEMPIKFDMDDLRFNIAMGV